MVVVKDPVCLEELADSHKTGLEKDWSHLLSEQNATESAVSFGGAQESFQRRIGNYLSIPARLQVRDLARPKFFKPRPVPFAIREAINQEPSS